MKQRDLRCLASGVSLLDAETMACLFVRENSGTSCVVSLPFWGCYRGHGRLEEIAEGPHASLVEEAFRRGLSSGTVRVPWEELGLRSGAIDDVEGIVSLACLSGIHALPALSWCGHVVQCALFEANVAAALMQGEPGALRTVPIEGLAEAVLHHPVAREIYGGVAHASAVQRCKFGLSFVSCAALIEELQSLGIVLDGPGGGVEWADRRPEDWLAQALRRFEDREDLLMALADYASSET